MSVRLRTVTFLEDEILNTGWWKSRGEGEYAYKGAIGPEQGVCPFRKRRDDTAHMAAAYVSRISNVKTCRAASRTSTTVARHEQDIKTQQDSLKKWLQTEKQGEAIVAVIYTRGFRDKEHDLESLADQASAALMAQHMGTYIQSFTRVIDNVLSTDFIRAIEEGTAKWNQEGRCASN
jgi:hypothetical protein